MEPNGFGMEPVVVQNVFTSSESTLEDKDVLCLSWILLLFRCGQDLAHFRWGILEHRHDDPWSIVQVEQRRPVGQLSIDASSNVSTLLTHVRTAWAGPKDEQDNLSSLFFENRTPDGVRDQLPTFQITTRLLDRQVEVTIRQHGSTMTKWYCNQLLSSFTCIFQAITRDAEQNVSSIVDLKSYELDQIWSWNADVPTAIEKTMVHDFCAKAASNPDAQAVEGWDGTLTYGELDRFSTRLAQCLISLGLGESSIVPLCFEKSMWTVVGVMAVLRAGAAFTLMDPSQPLQRLRAIVKQVNASVIVSSSAQSELGNNLGAAVVVPVSRTHLESPLDSSINLPVEFNTAAPMYIQFTSGSTGKPKGVIISHRSYVTGAVPRAALVGYHLGTRCLDFPSYAFDVSIDCMLCTLANGGCVCVPSEEHRLNDLAGAITRLKANMIHVTPSVARLLSPEIMQSVEVLGLGGELVLPQDVALWNRSCKLVIAYGPSECTVGCTINSEVTVDCTNIGKGVGGITWIAEADDHNRLVPLGSVGELLIEGHIVGDGYLNAEERSAESFIEDPPWLVNGGRRGRLYKTGDLVRYDPSGSGMIEFVGRKDAQVKIRGQRVELGEIEHHLRQLLPHTFSIAAEVIKPGGHGTPTLVAFVAPPDKRDSNELVEITSILPAVSEAIPTLEKVLTKVLPQYMVPTAYICLTRMPTLISLKTDRKELRRIGGTFSISALATLRSAATPTPWSDSSTERTLVRMWKMILGQTLEFPGDASFFQFGGDSLKAIRLVTMARREGISLSVSDIFHSPNLSEMVKLIDSTRLNDCQGEVEESPPQSETVDAHLLGEAARLCRIQPENVEDLYPCTPLQEGLIALSAKDPASYIAQRVAVFPSPSEATRLTDAFNAAAQQAPILRTRIVQIPRHGLFQVVVSGGLPFSQQLDLQGYIARDKRDSMGLGTALMRLAIIHDSIEPTTKLVLTMHHALYDGWSMPLIIERVNKIYRGDVHIPRAPPFRHFVSYLDDTAGNNREMFWKQYLDHFNPRQFPRIPREGYQTTADSLLEHFVSIPASLNLANITLANAIRAAWALACSSFLDSNDVVFGETIAGRNTPIPGVELIEGPMITTLPVRIRVNKQDTLAAFLQSVQENSAKQMKYEHTGLQNIRRVSHDARKACDLRTGLVIHPRTDVGDPASRVTGPADAFAPIDAQEAAREALKFNTFPLMLVATTEARGFLVMASFDSKCATRQEIIEALRRLDYVFQSFSNDASTIEELIRHISDKPVASYDCIQGVHMEPPQLQSSKKAHVHVTVKQCDDISDTSSTASIYPGSVDSSISEHSHHSSSESISGLSQKIAILIEIWSRLLNIAETELSLDSQFFELGGDSISAMKLVSEASHERLILTVRQIFDSPRLSQMAEIARLSGLEEEDQVDTTQALAAHGPNMTRQLADAIRPQLADQNWRIADVYSATFLQSVAIDGTIRLPRFSVRYELLHFDSYVNPYRLRSCCQMLVSSNEILRTVFAKVEEKYYGAVLAGIECSFTEHHVEGSLEQYAQAFCALDVQVVQRLGAPFVAFHHVVGDQDKSCLIIKISHAQYDEMCLPSLLHQLSALYEERPINRGVSFSNFVKHALQNRVPASMTYWKKLLCGSRMTSIVPTTAPECRSHFSVTRDITLSSYRKDATIASLPTAAWALCLAKRSESRDVVFGEVASGRNTGFPNADSVVGPCWQYIPTRIVFTEDMTYAGLLKAVQAQHIASSQYTSIGFDDIVKHCTDWPSSVTWFDSVVHQDVEHVETLSFGEANCRLETVYPHFEPLRELKFQVYRKGDIMTVEVVTFESWGDFARSVLDEAVAFLDNIVNCPDSLIEI